MLDVVSRRPSLTAVAWSLSPVLRAWLKQNKKKRRKSFVFLYFIRGNNSPGASKLYTPGLRKRCFYSGIGEDILPIDFNLRKTWRIFRRDKIFSDFFETILHLLFAQLPFIITIYFHQVLLQIPEHHSPVSNCQQQPITGNALPKKTIVGAKYYRQQEHRLGSLNTKTVS